MDFNKSEKIKELWEHYVSIEEIFGVYYELEEIHSHAHGKLTKQPLTVRDAELAGVLDTTPIKEKPF